MWWLVGQSVRRAPRRLLLAALAVAFPVATLAATLLYGDDALHAMTRRALEPTQLEMRALMTTLTVDPAQVVAQLGKVDGVRAVDRFGAAQVIVGVPGDPRHRVTARLFAVDPSYLEHNDWVRADGDLSQGALLNGSVADALPGASQISVQLPGDIAQLDLKLPVAGRLDAREARPWFAIPAGDVQGDIAVVPRAVLVDYEMFARAILPPLQAASGGASAATNPGLSELPQPSLEAHVRVDHAAYPADPAVAAKWSQTLRRVLERSAPGDVIVADNTEEPLTEAAADATNAKMLFLLLGVPGTLVAAALGLAAAAALTEAHRRDDALLRLRGASDAQLVRLTLAQGLLAGLVGIAVGLAVAVITVSGVLGHPAWQGIPAGRLGFLAVLAVAAGALTSVARLLPVLRASRRSSVVEERRLLPGRWAPVWLRGWLDLVALAGGVAILAWNVAIGGLQLTLVDLGKQVQTFALAFYVLMAPVLLWVGVTLLAVRVLLWLFARWSRADRARPLRSWQGASMRWLGRRPARAGIALILGALAVAFGAEIATFDATYRSAKFNDDQVAFASDLQLTPATDRAQPLPVLGDRVAATSPVRYVPARVGSDRKTVLAVETASYPDAAVAHPQIAEGAGIEALAADPMGVVVSQELAEDSDVAPGDTLPITIYPDDLDLSQQLELNVVGVFRSFPPENPFAELVVGARVIPEPVPAPDLYLARVAPGQSAEAVAADLAHRPEITGFTASTLSDQVRREQRSLTALNLDGLSRIEAAAAAVIAAVGVGVLGAFLVIERRREFAVLRSVGADTRQLLTGPILEGAVAAVGSLVIGIPLGVGLGMIAVRILGLFFALPPPLVTLPLRELLGLSILVLSGSAIAIGLSLVRISRLAVAPVLREP